MLKLTLAARVSSTVRQYEQGGSQRSCPAEPNGLLRPWRMIMPCGIAADPGDDEHRIDPAQFVPFFEAVHAAGWITEPPGFVQGWASYAAGMIENITLTPRQWRCRDGS